MALKSTGLNLPAQPPDFASRVKRNATSCSIIFSVYEFKHISVYLQVLLRVMAVSLDQRFKLKVGTFGDEHRVETRGRSGADFQR
jgi:hypothetical protein